MINTLIKPLSKFLPENNRWERIWKLAQVDFKKRYYNDKLGLFWALFDPILQVGVYYFAFSIMRGKTELGVDNFALFLFSALIFWKFFSELLMKGLRVMQSMRYLLESVQINKFDLFYSLGLSNLMALFFNIFVYIITAILFGVQFSVQAILIIPIIISLLLIGLGMSMIFAVIYIYIKDFHHIIQIFLLLTFWTSGVFFPAEKIFSFWPPFYYLNPFVGLFKNIRAIFLYNLNFDFGIFLINILMSLVILIIGIICIKLKSDKVLEKI